MKGKTTITRNGHETWCYGEISPEMNLSLLFEMKEHNFIITTHEFTTWDEVVDFVLELGEFPNLVEVEAI